MSMLRRYEAPHGRISVLYEDMLKQNHLLIAGATGSGKSVVINGIMHTALHLTPNQVEFILIDPKRVELVDYKNLPHTIRYASEPRSIILALRHAMELVDYRYRIMQAKGIKKWDGGHIYIIIDELADLMTTNKRMITPLIQRLAQIGRAAKVHLIVATQCPISTVIPTAIKVNFDSRVGLRTRCAQDSRNILGVKGCELLPRYGQGYYMKPEGTKLYKLPMISDAEIHRIISYWRRYRR